MDDETSIKHEAEGSSARDPVEEKPTEPSDAAVTPVQSSEPSVAINEASRLKELQADVRDQDDLERDIARQADKLLLEQADERDNKRLERTTREKQKVESQILKLHQRLSQPIGTAGRVRAQNELQTLESRNTALANDLVDIQQRIVDRSREQEGGGEASRIGRLPNESRRDYLIRTGKITPFMNMSHGPDHGPLASLQDALIDAEDEHDEAEALERFKARSAVSHRNLVQPGFDFDVSSGPDSTDVSADIRSAKRRKVGHEQFSKKIHEKQEDLGYSSEAPDGTQSEKDDDFNYVVSDGEESQLEDEEDWAPEGQSERAMSQKKKKKTSAEDIEDFTGLDDGNETVYQTRLQSWVSRRSAARERARKTQHLGEDGDDVMNEDPVSDEDQEQDEWFKPHPTVPDMHYDNGYRIPGDIHALLFDYQKTGVQWLWELQQQQVGGIIGDEMGLGKTIQVIAFIAGLHYSKQLTRPVVIVCPATVMKQWVNEFHRWWPPLRVSILHTSGSGMVNLRNESSREDALLSQAWNAATSRRMPNGLKAARKVVKRVVEEGHVLVTTYSGLQTYASLAIPIEWGCAVLDEGHKIRNPNTSITIHCKELRTPHRIILSGTPMQNNLTELWSLFDFVFPMRLGTLVNFRNQFEFPIRQGGYANASNLQVQTAVKCAETLKDAISPYLLQRFKIDVASDLPKKSEQVLFCKLTKVQREAYEAFLGSSEMQAILNKRRQVLYGVDILRKICNHPDLPSHKLQSSAKDYGSGSRSGKMQVVKSLLELWKDTGHKTLLFCQHRIMLDILEKFVRAMSGFNYRRMDGTTPIQHRQTMVDEFNNDPDLHVFLLTTKVGGLGVNLTGADRVIIYDPDWNPSTDMQARERAWRLGQKRDVTIYRLMTAGTIEEKIYHRQIFKQFLTNKILKDPNQRQTFQMSDLHDLFSLGEDNQGATETSKIFKDTAATTFKNGDNNNNNTASTAAANIADVEDEKRDIRKAAGVASIEEYQGEQEQQQQQQQQPQNESEPPTAAGGPSNANQEARIMEKIFARSGVHSALEHDQILNGKRVVRADPKIIEAEAKRVAAEAAEELRRAGEAARSVPIGTPTWTGQFGVAGRPEERISSPFARGVGGSSARRAGAGPSSASILANLSSSATAASQRPSPASRSNTNSPAPLSSSRAAAAAGAPSGIDFITLLRDFITAHGGSVYTQMLIDQFNHHCTTPQKTAEFKEMLNTIAVLEKGGRSRRGKWTLKPEYAKKR
ncbi:DNA-dependent ATPase RAD26 [Aspergillus brunneoviolaceus CBS 621.78]|uniref:DNA repair protein Rhp26/Rad26 n=1 Tax=Aspergillus brunneoviolaceus CBS 621.78 TaxID=1450534 RepID=A0ACD1GNY6_9EURO|nr:DNA repair protein Rhp26/Rad26 [Aspergillus brunneoviolaceus CBS 621.78]RAH50952.1 DNA repair protein Rhp26/Rad26 [Aspergillus brunneoviolaceus CBS 621.78]